MRQEENGQDNNQMKDMLRSALINWYPFRDGKRALLLGGNTEPLRAQLERHFSVVDQAAAGSLPDAEGAGYDCVVAADLVESCEDVQELLRHMFLLLADEGVLLLLFRNRFGLKYLCGGTDWASRAPFASLQPSGSGPRLYGRREMEAMLCRAGFAKPRCYFLMPDADFVQAVYTEDYLPNDSIRDRMLPFDLCGSPLVAWEGDLYDDMVREGSLPYTANIYLEECWKPDAAAPEKQVIYAALSTDRGKEHGFATVLYSDRTAEKRPLFPEGMKALEKLCANINTLKVRGILTVGHQLSDRGIAMPLVSEEGLLHYLRRQLPDSPEAFLKVFDRIYQDVLQSSPEEADPPEDLAEIWGAETELLKPVLETAFIDMIPYNAFWAEGRVRYTDQEFAVQDCPAKYVLFRALVYTWLHIPEAEIVLPLETVKKRFGLTELWDGFQHRETRFVAENRNWGALQDIWDHARPDRAGISDRLKRLDASGQLRALHAEQLKMLKQFDHVCREHGLRYMAVQGTLLGAVRHHGFIPWDDRVDVAMPREDYDRLLKLENKVFGPGRFLQTPRNDPGCFYGGYSGLCSVPPESEGKDGSKDGNGCCRGARINILPLDCCPERSEEQKRLQRRLAHLQRIAYAKTYQLPQNMPRDVPGSRISLYYLLAGCMRRRQLIQRIDNACRSTGPSSLCGILACYYGTGQNRNIWPAEAVNTVEKLPFEDMMIPVPAGWDEILRSRYGEEYMRFPPAWKRHRSRHIEVTTG